jgi:DNA-binding transcriptional MerR regulator
MVVENLTDIISACKLLDVSSRTLRYYEEIGLAESVRLNEKGLRYYNDACMERFRKILFLRRLGLSLEDIRTVVNAGEKTNEVIKTKYAYLYSELDSLRRRLRLIQEVISVAESGGDIYSISLDAPFDSQKSTVTELANRFTGLLLQEKFEEVMEYFDGNLRVYLPLEAVKKGWYDTLSVCGSYLRQGKTELEDNIVTQHLIYEKVGITVKYVFNNLRLSGLWMSYYQEEKKL